MNATLTEEAPTESTTAGTKVLVRVKIDDIEIGDDRRPINWDKVKNLAKSFKEVGNLHPPVTARGRLVVGRHRLEAGRMAGWTEMDVFESSLDPLHAQLAEIDENFERNELTRLERMNQLHRRKQLYEQLHPESKAGASQAAAMNRAVGNEAPERTPTFAEDAAATTGLSQRTIRQDIQIWNALTLQAQDLLRGSKLEDSRNELLQISREDPEIQHELVAFMVDGRARDIYQARRLLKIDQALSSEVRERISGTALEKDEQGLFNLIESRLEEQLAIVEIILNDPTQNVWSAAQSLIRNRLLGFVDQGLSKKDALERLKEETSSDYSHLWSNLEASGRILQDGNTWRRATPEELAQFAAERSAKEEDARVARDTGKKAGQDKIRAALREIPTASFNWDTVRRALIKAAAADSSSWYEVSPLVAGHFGLDEAGVADELRRLQSLDVIERRYSENDEQVVTETQERLLVGLRPDLPLKSQEAACDAIQIRVEFARQAEESEDPIIALFKEGYEIEHIQTLSGLPRPYILNLLVKEKLIEQEDAWELARGTDQADQALRERGDLEETLIAQLGPQLPDDVPGQALLFEVCSELDSWLTLVTTLATSTSRSPIVSPKDSLRRAIEESLLTLPVTFLLGALKRLPEGVLPWVLRQLESPPPLESVESNSPKLVDIMARPEQTRRQAGAATLLKLMQAHHNRSKAMALLAEEGYSQIECAGCWADLVEAREVTKDGSRWRLTLTQEKATR